MKLTVAAVILILAGLACFVLFKLIGSSIDADGHLHEPFGLLPIGFVLILFGVLGLLIRGICLAYKRWSSRGE